MNDQQHIPYHHGDVLVVNGWCLKMCNFDNIDTPYSDDCTIARKSYPYLFKDDIREGKTYAGLRIVNLRLATDEQIDDWNKGFLHPRRLHYSISGHKMKRYFHPFDRVLVRDGVGDYWQCDLFSNYAPILETADPDTSFPYITIGGAYNQCIPYIKSEDCVGMTTDQYIGTDKDFDDFTLL